MADNHETEGKPPRIKSVLHHVEELFCIVSLVFMALLPLAESAARIFFKSGVPASSGLMTHFLLLSGLLSGMICTRNNNHLSIGLIQYLKDGKLKDIFRLLGNLLSAFVAALIAWSSLSFIKIGLSDKKIGFISERVFALIIPVSFTIIALRFARSTGLKGRKIIFPILALLLGTAAAFPVIAKFIWGFDLPDAVFDICDKFYYLAYYLRLPLVVMLIFAALAGTPLFVIIGAMALLLMHAAGGEMDSVSADIYTSLTNGNIIAIPLFTLVGFFLSESRAGERLVTAFRSLFSWMPGGIILASVIICAFFTSFTGASGVTILALGGILYTILSEHIKYPPKFSIGLLTSVGSVGLLFPPSLPLILVGTTTQTNIVHMFVGGLIPGLILVLAMAVFGCIASIKIKIPVEKFDGKKALAAVKNSILEILLPVFLIFGYFTGIFSLVEISAAALFYVFIVEVFIHRDIKLSEIKRVFVNAIPIIGGVLSILALSKALSYYIVDTQAPANVARWMQNVVSSKFVFLLLLNIVLLVVGCLMDIFSAILIVLPLVAPLGSAYGIDPVHLGIIFIVNLEVGFLTPPVGMNLFLATYRFKKSFVDICRYVFPFLIIQLVVVLLVTYLPFLSTFLVGLIK
ncbi:MAG: TRAP transporter large permease subunit [Treponema sp.]|nr:TRAP transporter large permease subunit [Treponema sp.]